MLPEMISRADQCKLYNHIKNPEKFFGIFYFAASALEFFSISAS